MSKHGTEKSKEQLQQCMKEHMENEPNRAASLIQTQKPSQLNIEPKYGTERSNRKSSNKKANKSKNRANGQKRQEQSHKTTSAVSKFNRKITSVSQSTVTRSQACLRAQSQDHEYVSRFSHRIMSLSQSSVTRSRVCLRAQPQDHEYVSEPSHKIMSMSQSSVTRS